MWWGRRGQKEAIAFRIVVIWDLEEQCKILNIPNIIYY